MKFLKIFLNFFGYFSSEDIEAEIEFAEQRIMTIKNENKHYGELIGRGEANTAILDDLRYNCELLPFYKKEIKKWKRKLKKRKK
jgi:hypothetical protein